MASPRVSILMSVRDGEPYLARAMQSLLSQTFADIELIVVDDGSRDGTAALLAAHASEDRRVRVLTNAVSLGLTRSLNLAFRESRGAYVARQDADDWSSEHRIERQVRFLDHHPDVVLVGTAFYETDADGTEIRLCRPPRTDARIRWQICFHGAFCHSSVMFRRDCFDRLGGYDETLAVSQDFDLWSRMLQRGAGANLAEPLVWLRRHPRSVSSDRGGEQQAVACRVARGNFAAATGGAPPDAEAMALLRAWYYAPRLSGAERDLAAVTQVFSLLDAFAASGRLSRGALLLERCRWVAKLMLTPRIPIPARSALVAGQGAKLVRDLFVTSHVS